MNEPAQQECNPKDVNESQEAARDVAVPANGHSADKMETDQHFGGASEPTWHHAQLAFQASGRRFSCRFTLCEEVYALPSAVKDAIQQASLIHSTW